MKTSKTLKFPKNRDGSQPGDSIKPAATNADAADAADEADEVQARAYQIVEQHEKDTAELRNKLVSAKEHANEYFQGKFAEWTDGYRRRCENISLDLIEHARSIKNGSSSGAEEAMKTAIKSLVSAREEYDVWYAKTVTPIITLCDTYQNSFSNLLSEVATEERKHPLWSNKLSKTVADRLAEAGRYRFKHDTGEIERYFVERA